MMNRRGPSILPWGMPQIICLITYINNDEKNCRWRTLRQSRILEYGIITCNQFRKGD